MAKIGVMSFAHMHAYAYAEALKSLPNADFAGVWDDDAARGEAAAKLYGVPFTADMDAFLGGGLDGVIITSENMKHRAMVEKAAAAGAWILCEKPIAPNTEDAAAIVAACKQAKVGLGTAFPCRFIPALTQVKGQLDAGGLGALYAASCTNNGQFPGGWFADEALSGGGATMDHTVHVADVLRWFTGKEFTKVYCENGNLLREGINTDDIGALHLEMDGGLVVSHIASWNRPQSFPTWGDVTMELVGERGVVNVDAFNQKIDVYDDEAGKGAWAYWGGDPNRSLVNDFIAAIHEGREPAATGVDGLRAVEVTEAAYASAKSGAMAEVKRLAI